MKIDRRMFMHCAIAGAVTSGLASCSAGKNLVPGVPISKFDEDSTAEDVTDGLDLSGKVAVVTGCTSGIGFETMRVLALRGAWVVGTSRSLKRAEDACNKVSGVTSPVELDLSDYASIVSCAAGIRGINRPIDMLICNAGYRGGTNEAQFLNGIEKHFAVNHIGHFLFVNRLLDRLFAAWQGRIVVVASRSSYRSAPNEGIRLDDIALSDDYSDSLAYGQSKLANVLFAEGLARRLRGTRITANSLHPGVINTEIDRNLNRFMQVGFAVLTSISGKSLAEGAATSCYVATSKLLGATSGEYFEDCNAVRVTGSRHKDTELSDRLWNLSESLLADHLITHSRPAHDG